MLRQATQQFQPNVRQGVQQNFMARAIECAREAARQGEVPVAALVADGGGRLLALCQNRIERDRDPTAHAEMLAIRESLRKKQQKKDEAHASRARWLEGCSLYVTLEPCAMCAAAILQARLRRLFFAAYDSSSNFISNSHSSSSSSSSNSQCGAAEHGAFLLAEAQARGKIEVYGGIDETRAQEILWNFFRARRN